LIGIADKSRYPDRLSILKEDLSNGRIDRFQDWEQIQSYMQRTHIFANHGS